MDKSIFMYWQLINTFFSEPWAISPQKSIGYLPLLNSVLKGEKLPDANWAEGRKESEPKSQTYLYNPKNSRWYEYDSYQIKGEGMRLRVFTLNSVVTKYDSFSGAVGTTTLANYMKMADQDQDIDGVLLEIDSPGGSASYTKDLSDIISQMQKPVMVHISGLAASAAYWIASAADEVWASQKTDEIGSIGTMVSFADFKEAYEKLGVKIHEVYASKSVDKNSIFHEALKGNYKPMKTEWLDPMNDSFINSVKANREDKLTSEEMFSGKIYTATKALELGMIDGIGDRDAVLNRFSELIKEYKGSNNSSIQNQKNEDMNLINKVLGIKSVEESPENKEETVSTEEQFKAELQELKSERDQFEADCKEKAAKIATLESDLKTEKEGVEALKQELHAKEGELKTMTSKFERAEAETAKSQKEGDDNQDYSYVNTEADHYKTAGEAGL